MIRLLRFIRTEIFRYRWGYPNGVMEGHGEPCFYCGESVNSLAGNPSLWPLGFCQRDGTGKLRWHHVKCVLARLPTPVAAP